MTRRITTAFAATLALALGSGVVWAQTAPGSSNEAVMWGGNEVTYTPQGLILNGNAEVLQGENRLRASRLELIGQGGAASRVEASGDVYFVTPNETIRGDRAVYDMNADTVTVTGDVILTQGQNVATGGRLVYNVGTGAARLEGAQTPAGRRVQGVFYPNRSN